MWDQFLASPEAGLLLPAEVRVIEERPVSLNLAARVGVQHESPQALLIVDGKAVWHESHREITLEALTDAVSRYR